MWATLTQQRWWFPESFAMHRRCFVVEELLLKLKLKVLHGEGSLKTSGPAREELLYFSLALLWWFSSTFSLHTHFLVCYAFLVFKPKGTVYLSFLKIDVSCFGKQYLRSRVEIKLILGARISLVLQTFKTSIHVRKKTISEGLFYTLLLNNASWQSRFVLLCCIILNL